MIRSLLMRCSRAQSRPFEAPEPHRHRHVIGDVEPMRAQDAAQHRCSAGPDFVERPDAQFRDQRVRRVCRRRRKIASRDVGEWLVMLSCAVVVCLPGCVAVEAGDTICR